MSVQSIRSLFVRLNPHALEPRLSSHQLLFRPRTTCTRQRHLNICVLGAGIGGLTTAHELVKLGHTVTVYERNHEVGGLARTRREQGEASEYCWHGFGTNSYGNLKSLLREIPASRGSASTVADQLRPVQKFVYGWGERSIEESGGPRSLTEGSPTSFAHLLHRHGTQITFQDAYYIGLLFLFLQTCDKRRLDTYDDLLWVDFISQLSPEVRAWFTRPASVLLGLDIEKLNAHTMLALLSLSPASQAEDHVKINSDPVHFECLNGPMNEVWFDPWKTHLEEQGVRFRLGTSVRAVHCADNLVDEVEVQGPDGVETVKADYFVNALSVESIARVLQGAPSQADKLAELSARGEQTQLQVTFRLGEQLAHSSASVLYFIDSPWEICTRLDRSFSDGRTGAAGSEDEVLAAGIGIWHQPGVLFGKPARECTPKEIIAEVWAQMQMSPGMLRQVRTKSGRGLDELDGYAHANLWHTFSYDKASGELKTPEPKFSNNVGTLQLRPNAADDELANLVHATAYARTNQNIYNMESAAEAGMRAATLIHTGEARARVQAEEKPGSLSERLIRRMDAMLYQSGLKNPFEYLLTRHLKDQTAEAPDGAQAVAIKHAGA